MWLVQSVNGRPRWGRGLWFETVGRRSLWTGNCVDVRRIWKKLGGRRGLWWRYTCDMICMLKLGERDSLVRGAERRSWLSSPLRSSSSFRLRLDRRWAASLDPPLRRGSTTPLMLQVRFRLVSWMSSGVTVRGGDWALSRGSASVWVSAVLSGALSLYGRPRPLLLEELFWEAERPPVAPCGRATPGWLLLEAPEEKPSSGSCRARDSSPILTPSASVTQMGEGGGVEQVKFQEESTRTFFREENKES